MSIFTLHAYRHRPRGTRTSTRAQQTVEHREIGRKPRARRGQHALPEQAIQAARLREARAARSGWHSHGKPHGGSECSRWPRRKQSSRPCPIEAAVDACLRASTSAMRPCCTRCRSASQRATWRASSPCMSASRSCSAQPPLIHLPRGARLRKYREMQGGGGCSSGTSSHAGAPVTMAAIGNSTMADRLRT